MTESGPQPVIVHVFNRMNEDAFVGFIGTYASGTVQGAVAKAAIDRRMAGDRVTDMIAVVSPPEFDDPTISFDRLFTGDVIDFDPVIRLRGTYRNLAVQTVTVEEIGRVIAGAPL